MPYLNVKIAAPASAETCTKVATLLTELTASILGKKRELTAVAVEFTEPRQWFIGNVPLDQLQANSFYLDIKVTEGTNTKGEKSDYVHQVFAGMEEIIGKLAPASYIVIQEVRADAWGYQGQTQEFRYIRGKAL
jgi:4-oxalocrotonate tautomerase